MRTPIYLDHAAATPVLRDVVEAMLPYFSDKFYNPSANYLQASQVKSDIDQARSSVARIIGSRPAEIIFTAGATEANNLAIRGVMEKYPEANIVVASIEHEAVLAPAARYDCRLVQVGHDGLVELADLVDKIDDQTVLVSVMLANNEIGTIQPIKQIAEIIKAKRAMRASQLPLYLHTDAAQAANYLDLHVNRLAVDMMTLNGGKIYGPKQSGCLYVKSGIELAPLIIGGGQERGWRSGTENVANIVGFSRALEIAQRDYREERRRLADLQDYFFEQLADRLPAAQVNGSRKRRLPNNLHFSVPGNDNERLIYALDELAIMVAAGSACSASSDMPSHVLRAIGLDDEMAQASLRLTMGRSTTKPQLDHVLASLSSVIKPAAS